MELKEKVLNILEKIKPALQKDGGDIELVEIDEKEKIVLVRLKGACIGCPMSFITIKGLVEQTIKREIPEISGVKLVQ